MNKTLKSLAVILAILISSAVYAQESETPEPTQPPVPSALMLPLVMPCNESQIIFDMLQGEAYNESPIALGQGTVFRPGGQPVPGQLTLWYNTENKKNFTIVFTMTGANISCIISSGVNMELIPVMFGTPI